jgi:hypothetical protein
LHFKLVRPYSRLSQLNTALLLLSPVQGPGIEHLLHLLVHDSSFARAVQQQDTNAAASAAIGIVKVSIGPRRQH